MGNDIYMGGVRFTPDFDDMGAPQEQWYELSDGSGKGKVMIALAYQPSTVSSAFVCSVDRSVSVPVFAPCDPSELRSWLGDFWVLGCSQTGLGSWPIFPMAARLPT